MLQETFSKKHSCWYVACLLTLFIQAQVEYPYPIQKFNITLEGKPVQIAYMDAKSDSANNKTVMLFHGKNFNGYYWKDVIAFFSKSRFSRNRSRSTRLGPQR